MKIRGLRLVECVRGSAPIAVEAASGAQLLPRPRDPHPRQSITEWSAHLACSADQRRIAVYRDLAEQIIITYPNGEHHDHR